MDNTELITGADGMCLEKINAIPNGDRYIVQRLPEESQRGGIIIPDVSTEKPAEGIIVAKGRGRYVPEQGGVIEGQYAIGDRVIFGKYAGYLLNIDGQEYTVVREDEIIVRNLRVFVAPVATQSQPMMEGDGEILATIKASKEPSVIQLAEK